MAKMRLPKNLLLKKIDIMQKMRMTDVRKFNELVLSRIVKQYGMIKFDDPVCDNITYQECTIPKEHKEIFDLLGKHYGLNFTQLYAIEIITLAIERGICEKN